MSIQSPRISLAIAEHSMCHPGRPIPQGEFHAGSPSLLFCITWKSIYHDLMDVSYLEIQPKRKQYTIALITNPFLTTITAELWRLQTKQVERTRLPQCKITAAPLLCGLKVWLTLRCQLRAPYSPRIQFPICMTCIPANMNNFIPHL
jgi:hypothetical protein